MERLRERLLSALSPVRGDPEARRPPPPPQSPMRPRSSSVCSILVPDPGQIVRESLDQASLVIYVTFASFFKGLPIIPFGMPSFVVSENSEEMKKQQIQANSR